MATTMQAAEEPVQKNDVRRGDRGTLTRSGAKQLGQETAQWNRIALAIARALEA